MLSNTLLEPLLFRSMSNDFKKDIENSNLTVFHEINIDSFMTLVEKVLKFLLHTLKLKIFIIQMEGAIHTA
jgi:hypothetical protein